VQSAENGRKPTQPLPGQIVRHSGAFGFLRLTLHDSSYDWQFVNDGTSDFTDQGHETCLTANDPRAAAVADQATKDATTISAKTAAVTGDGTKTADNDTSTASSSSPSPTKPKPSSSSSSAAALSSYCTLA
jgi:hypothetical protein